MAKLMVELKKGATETKTLKFDDICEYVLWIFAKTLNHPDDPPIARGRINKAEVFQKTLSMISILLLIYAFMKCCNSSSKIDEYKI